MNMMKKHHRTNRWNVVNIIGTVLESPFPLLLLCIMVMANTGTER